MAQYDNNRVSVIIPVYNVAKYIVRTLDSVLNQNYEDIEIILVDDCSTDDSSGIIRQYQRKHSCINYIKQSINQGAAVARNTALSAATGRYVAFLDGDDEWCQNKLKKQIAFMIENNAAISCTALDTVDDESNPLGNIRNVRKIIDYSFILKNTIIATSTVIVDRNKTGSFRMPLRRGGQDYATWLLLMRNGTLCYGLNEILTHYRVLPSSLSSNKFKSIKQVWEIQTVDEHINKLTAIINVCCFLFNALAKRRNH
jgi:teichuronic acid biosynthesis glycosyltransferase TuaG